MVSFHSITTTAFTHSVKGVVVSCLYQSTQLCHAFAGLRRNLNAVRTPRKHVCRARTHAFAGLRRDKASETGPRKHGTPPHKGIGVGEEGNEETRLSPPKSRGTPSVERKRSLMAPLPDALPRFAPDLPLPPYSYVPGRFPHPISDPAGHMFGKSPEHPPAPNPDCWRESRALLVRRGPVQFRLLLGGA